jgi:hypothetical protein
LRCARAFHASDASCGSTEAPTGTSTSTATMLTHEPGIAVACANVAPPQGAHVRLRRAQHAPQQRYAPQRAPPKSKAVPRRGGAAARSGAAGARRAAFAKGARETA